MPDKPAPSRLRACAVLVLSSLMGGCEYGQQLVAMTRSTSAFTACTPDPRILCEPGSEALAARIAPLVPQGLAIIAGKQFPSFPKPVRLYVYASRESYARHGGVSPESVGSMTRGVVHISPLVLGHPDGPARIVAHELSHLNMSMQMGGWRMMRLPGWFSEGMATWASGDGAGTLHEPNVRYVIRLGKHFEPIEVQPWWRPFQEAPKGVTRAAYYEQARMFVRFMHDIDPQAFRRLLDRLGAREPFGEAVVAAYGRPLAALWRDFIASLST